MLAGEHGRNSCMHDNTRTAIALLYQMSSYSIHMQERNKSYAQDRPGAPHLRLRLQDGREEVAVAVLVLAPVLKVLKQRVQLVVRVALQVAVDADIPPVADLHASVRPSAGDCNAAALASFHVRCCVPALSAAQRANAHCWEVAMSNATAGNRACTGLQVDW